VAALGEVVWGHWITSPAPASTEGGIVRPSASGRPGGPVLVDPPGQEHGHRASGQIARDDGPHCGRRDSPHVGEPGEVQPRFTGELEGPVRGADRDGERIRPGLVLQMSEVVDAFTDSWVP
jgi:hypothetical protein